VCALNHTLSFLCLADFAYLHQLKNVEFCSPNTFYNAIFAAAVEQQAFDRVYRVGQQKKTYIHRIIVKGTVEEKILSLQKQKSMLASGSIDGTASVRSVKTKAQGKSNYSLSDLLTLFEVSP